MSIGNDIVLCPHCHGERGFTDCEICKGRGITFVWEIEEVKRREVKKKHELLLDRARKRHDAGNA